MFRQYYDHVIAYVKGKVNVPAATSHASEQSSAFLRFLLRVLFPALVAAVIVRSFFFEPFTIPSTSMLPTLIVGDYIFVKKYAYGYSRFSFPFSLPFFSGRIKGTEPQRGDLVVFRNPKKTHVDYVKRLIAFPGETVQMKKGLLYINDKPVKRQYLGTIHGSHFVKARDDTYHSFQETLDETVSYTTFEYNNRSPFDDTARLIVPENHYFVMGDNRDDSSDSRDIVNVGTIPYDHFIGKVSLIVFSHAVKKNPFQSSWNPWRWLTSFRGDRFLKTMP